MYALHVFGCESHPNLPFNLGLAQHRANYLEYLPELAGIPELVYLQDNLWSEFLQEEHHEWQHVSPFFFFVPLEEEYGSLLLDLGLRGHYAIGGEDKLQDMG